MRASARPAPKLSTSITASAATRASWATSFLKLADAKYPPRRLPLGSDTVERIEANNAFVDEGACAVACGRNFERLHQ